MSLGPWECQAFIGIRTLPEMFGSPSMYIIQSTLSFIPDLSDSALEGFLLSYLEFSFTVRCNVFIYLMRRAKTGTRLINITFHVVLEIGFKISEFMLEQPSLLLKLNPLAWRYNSMIDKHGLYALGPLMDDTEIVRCYRRWHFQVQVWELQSLHSNPVSATY